MSISASEKDWATSERDHPDTEGPTDLQEELARVFDKAVKELDLAWSALEEPTRSKPPPGCFEEEDPEAHDYVRMPPIEETVAVHLWPSSAPHLDHKAFTSTFLDSRTSSWSKYSQGTSSSIDFTSPALAMKGVDDLLYPGKTIIINDADEVWPHLYIGDMGIAVNCAELRSMQFTHVLNCAHSSRHDGEIYDGMGITYMGICAYDSPMYDMSAHFNNGAEFIHTALEEGGKILVHCQVGVSRSATIVLAYLMLKQNMTLTEAIKKVKERRGIYPNPGFLRQLINLHIQLYA
ncbi:dual specificity protein phosphatase 26-like [Rhinichthys klamathensis goyatoka]|uniref:dual specificity protein phosphatase 26-like n=1 Tax=Rhinichthys klamathensis goyatoka TaxID=3034132 RepID=UPI0024B4E8C7|nr:dual specificity protein phosphatase 26-like [Rhinichthys klamathensis goyatoka]